MVRELTVEATNVLLVLAARSCRSAEERLDPYPLLIRAVLDSPKTRPIIVGFEKSFDFGYEPEQAEKFRSQWAAARAHLHG